MRGKNLFWKFVPCPRPFGHPPAPLAWDIRACMRMPPTTGEREKSNASLRSSSQSIPLIFTPFALTHLQPAPSTTKLRGFLPAFFFSGAPDCRFCLRPVPFTPSCTTQLPTTTLPTSRCFARSFARFLGRQIDRFHASDAHYESDIRMQTSMRTLYSAFLHVLLF